MNLVKLYYELLKLPVFTIEDVQLYINNKNSARAAINRLIQKSMLVRIRRNLFSCISGETAAPVANRFQIGSRITNTSCISHHTAMEYYGITDQVFYEVYVSSETEFKNFSFDGYTYRYIRPRIKEGISEPSFSGGIIITDLERTLLDSINDMDKIAGIEEVISNIESLNTINENKLVQYLSLYRNQFLYQKTGYLLSVFYKQQKLSNSFYDLCREKAGKSTRYISSDYMEGTFDSQWNLIIPDMVYIGKNGGILNADI